MVNANIFRSVVILSACLASAKPVQVHLDIDNVEYHLDVSSVYPGYDLNLKELRLVQVHPDEEAVWWTELEKAMPILSAYHN